eukprot:TRINITY_DN5412_c0_g1_i1.p1 TRINITY_DN5412_c0_g1~~TRINITY_DN5412_c0_g1_i1.p1  ORF type:complete len:1337 (-),score=248.88 TRINITY_DN5412_c0_g1_i1:247-4257(-)
MTWAEFTRKLLELWDEVTSKGKSIHSPVNLQGGYTDQVMSQSGYSDREASQSDVVQSIILENDESNREELSQSNNEDRLPPNILSSKTSKVNMDDSADGFSQFSNRSRRSERVLALKEPKPSNACGSIPELMWRFGFHRATEQSIPPVPSLADIEELCGSISKATHARPLYSTSGNSAYWEPRSQRKAVAEFASLMRGKSLYGIMKSLVGYLFINHPRRHWGAPVIKNMFQIILHLCESTEELEQLMSQASVFPKTAPSTPDTVQVEEVSVGLFWIELLMELLSQKIAEERGERSAKSKDKEQCIDGCTSKGLMRTIDRAFRAISFILSKSHSPSSDLFLRLKWARARLEELRGNRQVAVMFYQQCHDIITSEECVSFVIPNCTVDAAIDITNALAKIKSISSNQPKSVHGTGATKERIETSLEEVSNKFFSSEIKERVSFLLNSLTSQTQPEISNQLADEYFRAVCQVLEDYIKIPINPAFVNGYSMDNQLSFLIEAFKVYCEKKNRWTSLLHAEQILCVFFRQTASEKPSSKTYEFLMDFSTLIEEICAEVSPLLFDMVRNPIFQRMQKVVWGTIKRLSDKLDFDGDDAYRPVVSLCMKIFCQLFIDEPAIEQVMLTCDPPAFHSFVETKYEILSAIHEKMTTHRLCRASSGAFLLFATDWLMKAFILQANIKGDPKTYLEEDVSRKLAPFWDCLHGYRIQKMLRNTQDSHPETKYREVLLPTAQYALNLYQILDTTLEEPPYLTRDDVINIYDAIAELFPEPPCQISHDFYFAYGYHLCTMSISPVDKCVREGCFGTLVKGYGYLEKYCQMVPGFDTSKYMMEAMQYIFFHDVSSRYQRNEKKIRQSSYEYAKTLEDLYLKCLTYIEDSDKRDDSISDEDIRSLHEKAGTSYYGMIEHLEFAPHERNSYLYKAFDCFTKASKLLSPHFINEHMIGKIKEKLGSAPKEYLDRYISSLILFREKKRTKSDEEQHLDLRYRYHASRLKYLLGTSEPAQWLFMAPHNCDEPKKIESSIYEYFGFTAPTGSLTPQTPNKSAGIDSEIPQIIPPEPKDTPDPKMKLIINSVAFLYEYTSKYYIHPQKAVRAHIRIADCFLRSPRRNLKEAEAILLKLVFGRMMSPKKWWHNLHPFQHGVRSVKIYYYPTKFLDMLSRVLIENHNHETMNRMRRLICEGLIDRISSKFLLAPAPRLLIMAAGASFELHRKLCNHLLNDRCALESLLELTPDNTKSVESFIRAIYRLHLENAIMKIRPDDESNALIEDGWRLWDMWREIRPPGEGVPVLNPEYIPTEPITPEKIRLAFKMIFPDMKGPSSYLRDVPLLEEKSDESSQHSTD